MALRKLSLFIGVLGGVLLIATAIWLVPIPEIGRAGELSQPAAMPQPAEPQAPPRIWATMYSAQTAVNCTLEITTTDKAPFDNHSFSTAASIANYTGQTLVEGIKDQIVATWIDYYRLDNAEVNYRYTVQAKPDWTTNYNLGMIVYDRNLVPIITDTNTFDNNYATVSLTAANNGPYYFKVFQISEQCSGNTYSLLLSVTAPTPTPVATLTPTPTGQAATPVPTQMAGFDAYEPNYTFNNATTIAPAISYSMNFVPWGGATVDNDYLKVRVKPGLQLTCETSDLDPGVDPRMAFYSGPSEANFIAANDDIQLGNFNSRLSYYSTFEGFIYILVGQGSRMDIRDTVNSDYKFSCQLMAPALMLTLTPAPDKAPIPYATPTPRPVSTPVSPIATPTADSTEDQNLSFRLIATPPPATATPAPSGYRTFRVVIYYDENLDGQIGAGEGVAGFFVQVLAPENKAELAHGYTDDQGQLSFTVPTVGTVRVVVPLLGFDRLIEATKPEVNIRIVPPSLPSAIP